MKTLWYRLRVAIILWDRSQFIWVEAWRYAGRMTGKTWRYDCTPAELVRAEMSYWDYD